MTIYCSTDHIFEVLIYLDCSSYYDSPHKRISHIHLIQEIVKKSGMRCRIGSEPSASTSDVKEIKDAVKRYLSNFHLMRSFSGTFKFPL